MARMCSSRRNRAAFLYAPNLDLPDDGIESGFAGASELRDRRNQPLDVLRA